VLPLLESDCGGESTDARASSAAAGEVGFDVRNGIGSDGSGIRGWWNDLCFRRTFSFPGDGSKGVDGAEVELILLLLIDKDCCEVAFFRDRETVLCGSGFLSSWETSFIRVLECDEEIEIFRLRLRLGGNAEDGEVGIRCLSEVGGGAGKS
jgi:hypothetical protein